jgi:hypothetical protein
LAVVEVKSSLKAHVTTKKCSENQPISSRLAASFLIAFHKTLLSLFKSIRCGD